jgi:hypothetical protein
MVSPLPIFLCCGCSVHHWVNRLLLVCVLCWFCVPYTPLVGFELFVIKSASGVRTCQMEASVAPLNLRLVGHYLYK